jgi:hypothetical protein
MYHIICFYNEIQTDTVQDSSNNYTSYEWRITYGKNFHDFRFCVLFNQDFSYV